MHYQPRGTSFVKPKEKTATPQKSMLLEKDLSMIEMKRKEFLNYWQEQKLKLQQVKIENGRRLSDFNGTIHHQTVFPPMYNRQKQEPMHIPELKPPNCRHHHKRSFSKSNILKKERNQDECVGLCASGVSGLFRRPSEIACSERWKEISRCQICGTSEHRESKVPLTKYQLKEIYILTDKDKDLQWNRQKMNQIQGMKAHLYQKKQILDKKIQSWCKDLK